MKSNDQSLRFLERFNSSGILENLKESNVASNSAVLDLYSTRIEKSLEHIQSSSESVDVLSKCKKIIHTIEQSMTAERIDKYIEFGKLFKPTCLELKEDKNNIEHIKKIAYNYLYIAKITKNITVKRLALEIADQLSK